jgi:hypothetical protein
VSEQAWLDRSATPAAIPRIGRRGIRIVREVTSTDGELVEQTTSSIVYRPDADGPVVAWAVRKLRHNGGDLWFGVSGHPGRLEDMLGADRTPEGHDVIWRAYLEGTWTLEDRTAVRTEIDYGGDGEVHSLPGRHAAERTIGGIDNLTAPHRTHVALLLPEWGLGVLLTSDRLTDLDDREVAEDTEWDRDQSWILDELQLLGWSENDLYQVFPGARDLSIETPGGYLVDCALTHKVDHEERTAGLSDEARADLRFGAYLRLLVEGTEELVSPRWII